MRVTPTPWVRIGKNWAGLGCGSTEREPPFEMSDRVRIRTEVDLCPAEVGDRVEALCQLVVGEAVDEPSGLAVVCFGARDAVAVRISEAHGRVSGCPERAVEELLGEL